MRFDEIQRIEVKFDHGKMTICLSFLHSEILLQLDRIVRKINYLIDQSLVENIDNSLPW